MNWRLGLEDLDRAQFNELLKKQQEAQQKQKFASIMGAIADKVGSGQSFGNYWLGKMRPGSNIGSQLASAMPQENPIADQMKEDQFVAQREKQRMNTAMMDPNSELSKQKAMGLEKVLPGLGGKLAGMSAQQQQEIVPLLAAQMNRSNDQNFQKTMQDSQFANQRALTEMRIGADQMKAQQTMAKEQEEKNKSLEVPGLGMAMNKEDAKALKAASESKAKLDRQISEMIDLRKEYGGEIFNRDAVARGKQLSKDILLAYKNLAKLGVLSKADEDIINAIIPKDPLEFTPFSAMTGQDPVMSQLEKFRTDINTDYANTVGLRLQNGEQVKEQLNAQKDMRDQREFGMDKAKAQPPQVKIVNGRMMRKVDGGWAPL